MTTLEKLLVKELGKALAKVADWKTYAKQMGEEVTQLHRQIRTLKRGREMPGHIFYYTTKNSDEK